MNGGLSRQRCVELRAQLADLGYGQVEAEWDELFPRRQYPVAEHRTMIRLFGQAAGKGAANQAVRLPQDVPLFGLNLRRRRGVESGPHGGGGR